MPKSAIAFYTLLLGIVLGLYLADVVTDFVPGERFQPLPYFGGGSPHSLAMQDQQLATGRGEITWPNGDYYSGEFQQGMMHGEGKLVYANGDWYEGAFRYGEKHGKGNWHSNSDGTHYSGEWDNGQLIAARGDLTIYSPAELAEHALYQHQQQLNAALDRLQAGDDQRIELFTLAAGTFGSEEVFRREIQFIESDFPERFNNPQHSVFLSNTRRSLDGHPLATLTSLEKSLQALAAHMNLQQDILFLYLTSHGNQDQTLAIEQPGLQLPDLSAQRLRELLDNSGIQWRVIVISACYSGGFIDALQNDNSLIITAAAADKTSFGCDDNNDFTYFGEAFFKEALPKADSFTTAFLDAQQLIQEWEARDNIPFSEPQMVAGDNILQQLKMWREQPTSH